MDAIDDWERERNRRITAIQGTDNSHEEASSDGAPTAKVKNLICARLSRDEKR